MIKYLFLLFTLMTFEAFGAPRIMIKFNASKVKQGSVVDAVIGLNSETTQKLQYNQLKGQNLGESFFVHQAKPLMTKGSWDSLESEAKIIVTKIPENKPLIHKLGTDTIEIDWQDVEFIATETPKQYVYGNFEAPSKVEIAKWVGLGIGIVLLLFIAFAVFKKVKAKAAVKKKKRDLKATLSSPSDYYGVVAVWKNKTTYVREFPHLEDHFKELEKVLFKYQFKAHQTEAERAEVYKAYQSFLSKSQGGFNGI